MATPQEISAMGICKAYVQPNARLRTYYLALAGWIRSEVSHDRKLPGGLLEKLSLTPEEHTLIKGVSVQEAYVSVEATINIEKNRGYAE